MVNVFEGGLTLSEGAVRWDKEGADSQTDENQVLNAPKSVQIDSRYE